MTALPYDLTAQLERAKVQILLSDTFSILDVVRAPVRDQLRTHDLVAVDAPIGPANEAPLAASLVITEQFLQDSHDSFDTVETELFECQEKKGNLGNYIE